MVATAIAADMDSGAATQVAADTATADAAYMAAEFAVDMPAEYAHMAATAGVTLHLVQAVAVTLIAAEAAV
jgi:hypothetical protein